jgi:hypothetical protein
MGISILAKMMRRLSLNILFFDTIVCFIVLCLHFHKSFYRHAFMGGRCRRADDVDFSLFDC